MLRACKYCGKIHDSKFICPRKPQRKYIRKDSAADDFRQKSRWKNHISPGIRREAGYLCEVCRDAGKLVHEGLSVHHIVPVNEQPGLADVETNLICLCPTCHERAENGRISREYLRELALRRIK